MYIAGLMWSAVLAMHVCSCVGRLYACDSACGL